MAECRAAGGELEQIQLLLGHASVQTTERNLGTKQDLVNAQRRDQAESGGIVRAPPGKRVDLYAARGNRRFVIEIETGKSEVQANIQKCAGNNATLDPEYRQVCQDSSRKWR